MAPPLHYGLVLFPGFQLLDVAGPMDILNLLSYRQEGLKLSILADTLDPVSTLKPDATTTFSQCIVPTHTFANAPEDIEVLLVPGGLGVRDGDNIKSAVQYVGKVFPSLKYLITVCTGSALVGQAGVLDGKRATSNKASFDWVSRRQTTISTFRKYPLMRHMWVISGGFHSTSSKLATKSTLGCRRQHLDKFGYQCGY